MMAIYLAVSAITNYCGLVTVLEIKSGNANKLSLGKYLITKTLLFSHKSNLWASRSQSTEKSALNLWGKNTYASAHKNSEMLILITLCHVLKPPCS